MENPLETARRILARHPGPALPYTELHHLVSFEVTGPVPRPDHLLRQIRARSDLFRIIDPGRGPWRAADGDPADPGSRPVPWLDPWVLLSPGGTSDAEPRVGPDGAPLPGSSFPRVRESVLNLGRTLDDASPTTVCRWLLIVREERALRRHLRT